jgi:serine/threonine protein kinase
VLVLILSSRYPALASLGTAVAFVFALAALPPDRPVLNNPEVIPVLVLVIAIGIFLSLQTDVLPAWVVPTVALLLWGAGMLGDYLRTRSGDYGGLVPRGLFVALLMMPGLLLKHEKGRKSLAAPDSSAFERTARDSSAMLQAQLQEEKEKAREAHGLVKEALQERDAAIALAEAEHQRALDIAKQIPPINGWVFDRPFKKSRRFELFEGHHVSRRDLGTVVIKTVIAGRPPSATDVARLENEARALSQLRSRFIVQLLDGGFQRETGRFFLVLPKLRSSLADHLASVEEVPLEWLLRIVFHAVCGLEEAHTAVPAIAHRDFKESNILLSDDGESGLLSDLETAKLVDLFDRDFTTQQPFTEGYAPVEQLVVPRRVEDRRSGSAEEARRRAWNYYSKLDSYAVGATLYSCLTAYHPYKREMVLTGKSYRELLRERSSPMSIQSLTSALPLAVSDLINACLTARRTSRPAVPQIRRTLEDILEASPAGEIDLRRLRKEFKRLEVRGGSVRSLALLQGKETVIEIDQTGEEATG